MQEQAVKASDCPEDASVHQDGPINEEVSVLTPCFEHASVGPVVAGVLRDPLMLLNRIHTLL